MQANPIPRSGFRFPQKLVILGKYTQWPS